MSENTLKKFIQPITLGYIPLCDAAPIIVAEKLGIYDKFGINVKLRKQLGWATIQNKLFNGELDASHALAPMLFSTNENRNNQYGKLVTALILNNNGNAITLSKQLYKDCKFNQYRLVDYKKQNRKRSKLIFASVYPFSYHQILLNEWLINQGLDLKNDVEIVILPPALMSSSLNSGIIDGFCVGEPWNSVAQIDGVGTIIETSNSLEKSHIEKVLLTSQFFADNRREEHLLLVSSLLEACQFCEDLNNRKEVVKILSRDEYLGLPKKYLQLAFENKLTFKENLTVDEPLQFYGSDLNKPTIEVAKKLREKMISSKLIRKEDSNINDLSTLFLEDIYTEATQATLATL